MFFDIKVGRCSQLNEYMKVYEYQRSRSLTDVGPNLSDPIFLNLFSSITTRPIEAKFIWSLLGMGNESLFKWSRSHDKVGGWVGRWCWVGSSPTTLAYGRAEACCACSRC